MSSANPIPAMTPPQTPKKQIDFSHFFGTRELRFPISSGTRELRFPIFHGTRELRLPTPSSVRGNSHSRSWYEGTPIPDLGTRELRLPTPSSVRGNSHSRSWYEGTPIPDTFVAAISRSRPLLGRRELPFPTLRQKYCGAALVAAFFNCAEQKVAIRRSLLQRGECREA